MSATKTVLQRLRELMVNKRHVPEPLQAYVVPSGDAHQNEYLASHDQRRAFVSGFTGSAGTAIVTSSHACLWTDGRYYLQAAAEMGDGWTLMKEGVPSTPSQEAWLAKSLPAGSAVGVDPMLMSYRAWKPLEVQLEAAGHHLVPVTPNLVDLLWEGRPEPPSFGLCTLPLSYTGRTSSQKVEAVRSQMLDEGVGMLVVTALDEIAWLLNMRGSDIPYNPVFFSYVVVTAQQLHLFMDEAKVTPDVRAHWEAEGLGVKLHPYEHLRAFLGEQVEQHAGRVWVSPSSSYGITSLVPANRRLSLPSPVAAMKAVKNTVEINGMVNAHQRDGAAVCCYLAWLEKEVSRGEVTEVSGAAKLEEFRSQQADFVGLSFNTISAVGANGAITHYSPSAATDRTISTTELYLCDSGAQYRDGTTDITRTVHLGTPSQYQRECFTRVLKGQIFLGTCVFPAKIKGNCLDTLARKFLWDVGLDYLHGTGHGIGSFLNVHEGPMGISWRVYPDDPGLEEGMFLSNEPGYYEHGHFGIRLENIVHVVAAQTPYTMKERSFLTFDTVTLVPIQTKMLELSLLSTAEVCYLNEYHQRCRETVGPLLQNQRQTEAYEWLCRETQPVGECCERHRHSCS